MPGSHKRDIDKQRRSGVTLFACKTGISTKHGHNKIKQYIPSIGKGPVQKVETVEFSRHTRVIVPLLPLVLGQTGLSKQKKPRSDAAKRVWMLLLIVYF